MERSRHATRDVKSVGRVAGDPLTMDTDVVTYAD